MRDVLIVSHSADDHLDLVLPLLGDRCFLVECDKPFEFTCDSTDLSAAKWSQGEHEIRLADVHSIWNRRAFSVPGEEQPHQRFTRIELRESILQALQWVVPFERWINHPTANESARSKLVVSNTAQQCGLSCPSWAVSNNMTQLTAFAESVAGRIVLKPLSAVLDFANALPSVVYARPLERQQFTELMASGGTFFPLFIQEEIPKVADWRISIVDGSISAVRMTGCPSDVMDFRRAYEKLSYESISLPPQEASALRELMARLRLRYAAIDMVEHAESGRLFFLEVNASGQFGWMEKETGLGGDSDFSSMLAKALLN